MGRIVRFYRAVTDNTDTKSDSNVTSIDQSNKNGPYFGNYSDAFTLMKQISSELPMFKDRQLLLEKYEKLNQFKGRISNRVYNEWLNNLKTEYLEDLRKTAHGLSIQELQSHPAYALALFHTIFEKEKSEKI
jgi:hypothetical protein